MPPRKLKSLIKSTNDTPSSLANSVLAANHADVPTQGSNIEYVEAGHTSALPPTSLSSSKLRQAEGKLPPKGIKRGRKPKVWDPDERTPKRSKLDGTLADGVAKINLAAEHVPLVQEQNIRNLAPGKRSTLKLKVKWTSIPLTTSCESPRNDVETSLKPRLWVADKKELLATFPDLNGPRCHNNVSWEAYATPLILLDDEKCSAFDVQRDNLDAYTMDLVTLRSFVCPVLQVPNPSLMDTITPKPVAKMPEKLQPSLKSISKRRIARQYPAPQNTQESETQVKINFAAPLPTYTLHMSDHPLYTISPGPDFGPEILDRPMAQASVKEELSQLDASKLNDLIAQIPELGPDLRTCTPDQLPGALQKTKVFLSYEIPSELAAYCKKDVQKTTPDLSRPSVGINPEALPSSEAQLALQADTVSPEHPPLASSRGLDDPPHTNLISYTKDSDQGDHFPPSGMVEMNRHPLGSPLNGFSPDKRHIEAQVLRDSFIPSPLPQEIQTIINAYISGKPVAVVVTHNRLLKHWSLEVSKKYGYIIMGYFRIIGVQEERANPSDQGCGSVKGDTMSGQVEWRFRLQWAPGGEKYILTNTEPSILEHPWWYPPSEVPGASDTRGTARHIIPNNVPEEHAFVFPKEPEDFFHTTPLYKEARIAHGEYKFRHNHLDELYESLLPTTLLAPYGPLVLDSLFPRSWFCLECGKVNFQAALRHRKCTNLECKDKSPPVEPYAIPLVNMRDPQDRLPISMPYNVHPTSLRIKLGTFDDGMKVVSYYSSDEELAFVKHVFTGNNPRRQSFATDLLMRIQKEVELVRPTDDSSPYFTYSAASPKGHIQPTATDWPKVEPAVNTAKSEMVRRTRCYAEVPDNQLTVTRLNVLAWVTAGIKKGIDILRTKNKVTIFLSLGCDVELTLIPRGDWPTVKNINRSDVTTVGSSILTALKAEAISQALGAERQSKSVKKADRPTFNLTLVHGDIIVLYGEDFEYSIKRDGTSILMIASHED